MTDYFLDASALVKRYVDELGSTWVRSITDPDVDLLLAARVEGLATVNALDHSDEDSSP